MTAPPIPVGIRLPHVAAPFEPGDLVTIARTAVELGYRSVWVGDHLLMPASSSSVYPHTADGHRPFGADTPYLDPLLALSWLSVQVPEARIGTSVIIMTLRRAALLAKQIATASWLTRKPLAVGIGSGWSREEYDAVGVRFEKRAARARADLAEIRELISRGSRRYQVRGDDDELVDQEFHMRPTAPAPVEFLWGGVSPLAIRLVASSCEGWLPAKQSLESLENGVRGLRAACDDVARDFDELRLVVKPGPGPDPRSGAIDKDNLAAYAELGFHEAVLELSHTDDGLPAALATIERVATRAWG